jgi:hypothetical protein
MRLARSQMFKIMVCSLLLAALFVNPVNSGVAQKAATPAEEAQFTPEQLKTYYLIYENPDVRYLRTLFDAYLGQTGGTEQERRFLEKWNKEYYQSKFIVLSREISTFGGALITILFQKRPDKVFVAWVYPEGSEKELRLKNFTLSKFDEYKIKRIQVRYKKLIEDSSHAM